MLTEYENVRMLGGVGCTDVEPAKAHRHERAAASDLTNAHWKPFLTLYGNRERLLLAAMFLHAAGARADQADTWNLFAGINQTHDANLFRLADSVDPMTVAGKPQRSEDITSTHFGVSFDKPVSMQRFRFDYTISENRYETYSYLNFAASSYSGTWNWALTPHLGGTLSARHSERLADFSDYRNSGRNVQKSDNQRFDVEWEAHGPWRLIAAVSRDEAVNSQVFLEASDSLLTSNEVGGKYLAKSGSWISVVARRGEGEYPKLQYVPFSQIPASSNPQSDNGYSTKEEEVRLYWALTGKSSLNGRISHVSREHDHFSQRDYSGYAGQADYNWNAGGKIRLNFSARQALASWQDKDKSSYYVARTYSVNPVWQFSSKASARLQLSQEERDFKGPLISGLTQRQDKLRSGMLVLDWVPLNSLSLSASIQHEERESSDASFEYKDTILSLSGRLFL